MRPTTPARIARGRARRDGRRWSREVVAEQQAIAALWGRLAKRRAREFERDA